ncbi:B12-binding domain-containing radical SAM protein [Candidatus Poribacteria bacterium]
MPSEKVLLINSNQMKPVVTPIALDYLGHALKKMEYEVDLLDLSFSSNIDADLSEYFRDNSPAVIGVTARNVDDAYYLSQDFFVPKIGDLVKGIRRHADAPIVLGGVGFSIMSCRILEYSGANFGIKGEGEYAFPELVRRILTGEDHSDIPGLVYRSPDGVTSNPQTFGELDLLWDCRREFVDNERYFREGGMGSIETRRGCGENCIYCPEPSVKGHKYRLRDPEHVVDEIQSLLHKGITHFHTCDSEFNLPGEHAEMVCREIVKRGLGKQIQWYAYASPTPFSEELMCLMQEAGCIGIDFGVDSGNDVILKNLGRRHRKEDVRKLAKLCHKYGMIFMYDLLLGGPGETEDTLRETIELMKEAQPSRVGVSAGVRIYPRTPLAKMIRKDGVSKDNPALFGNVEDNEDFFQPIFYISPSIGGDIHSYVSELIGGDDRFLVGSQEDITENYNYNDNSVLVEAIRNGARGAFWAILLDL